MTLLSESDSTQRAKPHINHPFQVLDHGCVTLLDVMGSDEDIAQAAWVSTEGVQHKRSPIPQFLDYLMRHKHMSPFEMCEVKFKLKIPLFVMAQLATHRTASRNQISARYATLPQEVYTPAIWRGGDVGHNKQGSDERSSPGEQAELHAWYARLAEQAQYTETSMREHGVAPELARLNQLTSQYTEVVWKIDLRNLMNFLTQRTDTHAQYEIRQYAEVIERVVSAAFPHAMNAWRNHVKQAVSLSRDEQLELAKVLRLATVGDASVSQALAYELSKGSWRASRQTELTGKLNTILEQV